MWICFGKSNPQPPNLYIADNMIERVDTFKLLDNMIERADTFKLMVLAVKVT